MKFLKSLFNNRRTGMRLSHIIESVYLKPLLITADGFKSIDKVIQSKLASDVSGDFRTQENDLFGDPLPVMEVTDKIAYIPICGPIAYKVSGIERVCGICDIAELKQNLKVTANDDQVEAIFLDVSTPGGSTTHVAETAQLIADIAKIKPVVAFTDDICASAGYYLIAGANEIYSTPSSDVGSIGCYMALLDYSKMYEQAGVKPEVFTSGIYKGMGYPGLPLTEAQKELIQSEVDTIANEFKSFVKAHRPQVKDEAMEGQTFFGKSQIEMGLVDQHVSDADDIFIR